MKEYTIEFKFDAKALCDNAEKSGFLFDYIDTNLVKFAFTEKRTQKDIDDLINFLSSYNG